MGISMAEDRSANDTKTTHILHVCLCYDDKHSSCNSRANIIKTVKKKSNNSNSNLGNVCMYVCMYVCMVITYSQE